MIIVQDKIFIKKSQICGRPICQFGLCVCVDECVCGGWIVIEREQKCPDGGGNGWW